MDFHINPQNGFLEVPIGISKAKVRALFPCRPYTKKALPWDIGDSDYYDDYELRFTYDQSDCVKSIAISLATNVYLNSVKFKGKKLKRVISDLKQHSYEFTEDLEAEVLFNDDLGLSLFTDGKIIEAFELISGTYVEAKELYTALMDKYPEAD